MKPNWIVRELLPPDDPAYEQFLHEFSRANPAALGYHYPFYRNIIEKCGIGDSYYVGLFDDGRLIATLPGFIKTSSIGQTYCSMPFFGPNAGVMCSNEAVSLDAHLLLIDHVVSHMKKLENPLALSFYTPFLHDNFYFYEQSLQDYFVVEKNTQYLDVQLTDWDNKIKYDLRKADRLGLSITESVTPEKVDCIINIYNQNCLDYGIPPKPKQFIYELAKAAIHGDRTKFYFAHHEGGIIGGLIVLYSDTTLSYYLPCSQDDKRTLQPVTFMIDYAFKQAKERGIRYWNWESSPDQESGVYKFKRKWGSIDGKYRIYGKLICDIEKIEKLGGEMIRREFPYFFVFPFDKISKK